MPDEFEINLEWDPRPEVVETIRAGLMRHNVSRIQLPPMNIFALLASDPAGALGGVYGWLQWGWVYVERLWVEERARRRGIGSRLMAKLEEVARAQGVSRLRLFTASFQGALPFYRTLGYTTAAQLPLTALDGSEHEEYLLVKHLR